jgi:putative flippase GtrA
VKKVQQFLLFSGIGAIGTVAHYSILILMVQLIHADPVIATTVGFIAGALVNYTLNYHITFSSNKRHRETLTKFFSVATAGACINSLIMSVGINIFDVHYLIIQLMATCIVLTFNFVANSNWTFADR